MFISVGSLAKAKKPFIAWYNNGLKVYIKSNEIGIVLENSGTYGIVLFGNRKVPFITGDLEGIL